MSNLKGGYRNFIVTMPSAGTFSGEVDLGCAWTKVFIAPAGAASEVRFLASEKLGGTYGQCLLPQGLTSTVESNIWKVASAASGSWAGAPSGYRFMKIELTAAVANGTTVKLICSQT